MNNHEEEFERGGPIARFFGRPFWFGAVVLVPLVLISAKVWQDPTPQKPVSQQGRVHR